MKIAIAGIGGVGGYFGGMLAHRYAGTTTSVSFIARGRNLEAIRDNGLTVETSNGNFHVHPLVATSAANEIGEVDLLLVCCKSYDLDELVISCMDCISKHSVILPLLNGVESGDRIRKIYSANETWDGCVYLVSRLAAPLLIKESGNIRKLHFGSAAADVHRLKSVEALFTDAAIDASYSERITEVIWEKFLFLSPIATLTSYLDKNISEVFSNGEYERMLNTLVAEIKMLSEARNIFLPAGTTQKNLDNMRSLPAGATTSMHSDFRKGEKTELDSLTGYVVREAKKAGLRLPLYEKLYGALSGRS